MKTISNQFYYAALMGIGFALVLGGCAAADGRYPSLAVRDAERVEGTFSPAPSDTGKVSSAVDTNSVEAALEQARTAHAKFVANQREVASFVTAAAGLSLEDDRRAQALAGLAQLTSLRGETALALGELDLIEVKAATGFARTDDVRAAQAAVLRLVAQQDATIDALAQALNQ